MPHKTKEVRDVVRKYDVQIVGLLDTRVKESRMQTVLNNTLPSWRIEHNYHHSEMRKIWVCWKICIGRV